MASEPRWILILRALGALAIVALGILMAIRILASDASGVMKTLGILGFGLVVGGGAIRIWLASRPYGLGAWNQRKQGEPRDTPGVR